MRGVWAPLGVVTGGPLVRLMEVIWVVVIMAGIFAGFSVITAGLSGWIGRDVGPCGGVSGNWLVVLDVGAEVEEVWRVLGGVVGFSLVEAGDGDRGGICPSGGCLRSTSAGGTWRVGSSVGGEWWVWVVVGIMEGLDLVRCFSSSCSRSFCLSFSRASSLL